MKKHEHIVLTHDAGTTNQDDTFQLLLSLMSCLILLIAIVILVGVIVISAIVAWKYAIVGFFRLLFIESWKLL